MFPSGIIEMLYCVKFLIITLVETNWYITSAFIKSHHFYTEKTFCKAREKPGLNCNNND